MANLHIGPKGHVDALKGSRSRVSNKVIAEVVRDWIVQPEPSTAVIEGLKEIHVDVVREVPVEVIKEVEKIVEVIKEVRVEVPVIVEVIREVPKDVEKVIRIPVIEWKYKTPRWAWASLGIITLQLLAIIIMAMNK